MFFSLILEIKIIVGAPKFVRFIPKYFNKCGKEFFDTKLEYQDLEIDYKRGNEIKLKHPYEMIDELNLYKNPEDGSDILWIKTKQNRRFQYLVKIQPSDVNSGVYDLDRITYMGGLDENGKELIKDYILFNPRRAKKLGKVIIDEDFKDCLCLEIYNQTDSEIEINHREDMIAEFIFLKHPKSKFWHLQIIKKEKHQWYNVDIEVDLEHPNWHIVRKIIPIDNIKLKSNSENIQKNEMNISSSNVINDKNKEIKFDEIEQMTNQQESKFIKSDSQYNVGRNDDEIMSINNESDQENLFGVKQENYEDDKGNITAIFPDE